MRVSASRGFVVAAGLALMVPGVGLAAGPAVSSAATAIVQPPVQPLRAPNGAPLRGPNNTVDTSNWSGYEVANYQTGSKYTSASATWTVPTVTPPTPSSATSYYSSSWVGIGGFCVNSSCRRSDSTLIQLGTEQDVTGNTDSYYAWYELLPNASVVIPLTVKAGDTVTASLSDAPAATTIRPNAKGGNGGNGGHGGHGGTTTQSWTLSMSVNGGTSWSTTLPYASSELSAEWIEEAPAGCIAGACFVLPLANFGKAQFDPVTANGAAAVVAGNGIGMINPNGQYATPSGPDSTNDGFNVCWSDTAPTAGSCTVSAP